MKIVGLTGGIGSGKSTVAKMFRELGVPVYDSDLEAKQLMSESLEIKEAIVNLLGDEAYLEDVLNRAYIAEKVFNDKEKLQSLNAIVHPAVKTHFLKWAESQTSPYVVQETALIFENRAQEQYDYTILITAPLELRIQRTVERDNATIQQVLDRMKNQMDDNKKADLANFCIVNIEMEETKKRVSELHARLMVLANQ
ncbi:dephospho-CoA kinase [Flagellimonas nanhaiensis]|uniref:Dephospho-CoA kinase n=1 Tax=Flagellimonas nanhaiensis TaxID=2292706 RepID=A0A371JU61_9FLAO|nr:dephospho-CoA kinase [Allomuricauda nanhaiensis]RDY61327.1 dephospho-CoA kinase [Allomuricauda nanhaiensis]